MAEQMALRVLRPGGTEIGADAPVGGGAFLDGAGFDRHAAEQDEASAFEDLGAQAVEDRA
jgi:hypothetical protein